MIISMTTAPEKTTIPVNLTFRPLARGYFRCNQTGAKVKNCENYRRSQNNGRNQIPREAMNLPRVKLGSDGKWVCPNERNHSFWRRYSNKSENVRVIDYCGCGQAVWIAGRASYN